MQHTQSHSRLGHVLRGKPPVPRQALHSEQRPAQASFGPAQVQAPVFGLGRAEVHEKDSRPQRRLLQPLHHQGRPVQAGGRAAVQVGQLVQPHQLGHPGNVRVRAAGEAARPDLVHRAAAL